MIISYIEKNEGDFKYIEYKSDGVWSVNYSQKLWGFLPQIAPIIFIHKGSAKYEYKFVNPNFFLVSRRAYIENYFVEERRGLFLLNNPESVTISEKSTKSELKVTGKYSWFGRKLSEIPQLYIDKKPVSYTLNHQQSSMPDLQNPYQTLLGASNMAMFNKESTYDFNINSEKVSGEAFSLVQLLIFPHLLHFMLMFQSNDKNLAEFVSIRQK